jgi:hypothetical protein
MRLTAKECIRLQEALEAIKPKQPTIEEKREFQDLNSKLFDIAHQASNGALVRQQTQKM